MTTTSKIEWTEQTWNPTVGCTKISPGCKHCYAETMATPLQIRLSKSCRAKKTDAADRVPVVVVNERHFTPPEC
jgi:protein gp37